VKTVLEEPQDLAAHLGGVAEYRAAPVGAIGPVGRGDLAPVLLAQCFLVLGWGVIYALGTRKVSNSGE